MNIGRHLGIAAGTRPDAPALKIPRGRTREGIDYLSLSFAELDAEAGAWQARMASRGVVRGDRAMLLARPGLPLIASVFALFRLGAVPVVIDPGMPMRSFLKCVARTRPRVLVGPPLAQFVSRLLPGAFRSVRARVTTSRSLTARLGSPALSAGPGSPARERRVPVPCRGEAQRRRVPDRATIEHSDPLAAAAVDCAADELAAILFTSGSTGAPKGVRYDHGMFEAQVALIRETYALEPGEVDLALLPIFALFNPALGMTTVVPELDPRRPAAADPARIVEAINQEKVTNSFGSPTLWNLIAGHCRSRGVTLPTLRRVLCAGAPVPGALWSGARGFLPNGRMHSPYGATEALPVSSISDAEVASLASPGADVPFDAGAPVGRPLRGIEVRIIAVSDDPIPSLEGVREMPRGEIGEIIVRGPVASREYDALPEATRRAKIADSDGSFWHRMGDCGFLDSAGRLWFCGRAAERVVTADGVLHTEPCERVFRVHPRAGRCALIGLGPKGRQTPALAVEARPRGKAEAEGLAAELAALARKHRNTEAISRFYFFPRFPVDVRHNAKIHRLTLADWASHRAGYAAPAGSP